MSEKWDYNKIMSDHKLFNEVVYTPLSEAIKILEERQKDPELVKKIEKLLNNDIPEPLRKLGKNGISTKQLAVPNCDTKWFLKLTEDFGMRPIFSEYLNDKFTSNNSFKYSLGVVHLDNGISGNGERQFEKIKIVDFDKYDGKLIKEVLTNWGEPLVDFYKKLFKTIEPKKDNFIFYDASEWLERNGATAENYYKKDLLLYLCHGILFENFLLTGNDCKFTKNVFLPALKEVLDITGLKPLIVPIPPMDMEEDVHWILHDKKIKKYFN